MKPMNPDISTEPNQPNAIALSLTQTFELEKMQRSIDSCNDVSELKALAKQLLSAWMTQKAACLWIMRQNNEKLPSMTLLEEYRNLEK
jgi:hypothetical protein